MQVICINGTPSTKGAMELPEGISLSATQSDIFENAYLIEGFIFKNGMRVHHRKERFIPVSDIDGVEVLGYRNLSLINQ